MKVSNKRFTESEEFHRRNYPRTFCANLAITITKLALDNILTCEKTHCFRLATQIFPGNVLCFSVHELLNRLIFCLLSYKNLDLQFFVDFIFGMRFSRDCYPFPIQQLCQECQSICWLRSVIQARSRKKQRQVACNTIDKNRLK